jgi:hypothetical protein
VSVCVPWAEMLPDPCRAICHDPDTSYRMARCVIRTRSLRHCSIRRQTDCVLASTYTGMASGHADMEISLAYAAAINPSTALMGFSVVQVGLDADGRAPRGLS